MLKIIQKTKIIILIAALSLVINLNPAEAEVLAKLAVNQGVPILSNGQEIETQDMVINGKLTKVYSFKTIDSAGTVLKFYRSVLESRGWKMLMEDTDRGVAAFSNAQESIGLTVIPIKSTESDFKSDVTIAYNQQNSLEVTEEDKLAMLKHYLPVYPGSDVLLVTFGENEAFIHAVFSSFEPTEEIVKFFENRMFSFGFELISKRKVKLAEFGWDALKKFGADSLVSDRGLYEKTVSGATAMYFDGEKKDCSIVIFNHPLDKNKRLIGMVYGTQKHDFKF